MLTLKNILLEYISDPIITLKKYLTQSDDDKKKELALNHDCLEFLARYHPNIYEKYRKNNYGESSEILMKEYPDVFKQWSEFLLKKYDENNYYDPGYPTWNYLSYQSIVKNQWLIHFSNQADYIYWDQKFNRGVYDHTRLGLTTQIPETEKDFGGYNFAYLLNDYERYGRDHGRWKYGKRAVLFKASGIEVWHYGDAEPQVIFWGPSAFDIVLLKTDSSGDFYVQSNHEHNSPYHGDLNNCVDWVVNNFDQYKKVLIPK